MAERQGRQQEAAEMITAVNPANRIFWSDDGRIPKFITGKLSEPSPDEPARIARRFIETNSDLFAMELPAESLETVLVEKDSQGHSHVSLAQYIGDISVHEGSVQVHIDPGGVVTAYKDNRLAAVEVDLKPILSEEDAWERARQDLGKGDGGQRSRLCLFRDRDKSVHLAWEVTIIRDDESGPRIYFIDAHEGTILYRFSENRGAMSRRTFTANNENVLPGSLVIEDSQHSADDVVQAAHANAGEVYSYYKKTFDRDSFDNRGAPLVSTVHFGRNYNNAYWSSYWGQMVYGDGDGASWLPLAFALDIVGHEFTHAISSRTARFVYAEQSGALDEAFADFFGVMITNDGEISDWEMGEGVYTPFRSGDALRDLADPPRFGLPDHMDDFIHLRPDELPDADKNDLGWVHVNCGIPCKAAYLTVAGGEHHGIRVEGLGREKTEQIYYLGLTEYLRSATQSRWTFMQARYALLNACRQLYGDQGPEYAAVKNGWAAVGVGEPAEQFELVKAETSTSVAIPDNDPRGIVSSLTVDREGLLKDITVFVLIHHSYISDLRVRLISPAGEEVVLHDRSGGPEDDIIEEYSRENSPALTALVGDGVRGEWRLAVSDHAGLDEGSLESWGLSMALEKMQQLTLEVGGEVGLPIPDNSVQGVSSRLFIEESGSILHLDVKVEISHTWIGDLRLILVSPAGLEFILHDKTGSSRHDINRTYSTKTEEILRQLMGQEMNGEWILKVMDLAGQDTGIFRRWALKVIYSNE